VSFLDSVTRTCIGYHGIFIKEVSVLLDLVENVFILDQNSNLPIAKKAK